MATEVAQLIFKADTSQIETADKKVAQLGRTTSQTANRTSDFGRRAGMAGIQIEQLSNQIAGGQNAMRAFGMQAADIGFLLGTPMLGAVIGVSAALASMIPNIEGAEGEIEKMADSVLSLETNLNNLTQAQRAAVAAEFTKDINQLNKEISGSGGLNTYLEIATEKMNRLQAGFDSGNFVLPNGAITSQEEFEKVLEESKTEVANLQANIDLKNASIARMEGVLNGTISTTEDYITALREEMIVTGMNARQKAIYKAQAEGATQAQIDEINAIYDTIDAKNAAIASQKAEQAERKRAEQAAQQQAAREERVAKAEKQRFKKRSELASQSAAQMALLSLDEKARADKEFENEILALKAQKDKKLITEQEYNDALAGIVAERARTIADIELKEEERKQKALQEQRDEDDRIRQELYDKEVAQRALQTDMMLAFEDQLLKGKSDSAKAAYRIGMNLGNEERRENARQIISSSYTAAMGAYEALAPIPIIGPALGAAAAGTILAAGVSFAAKSLSGRALGGQVRPGESYIVGERGPEVLTMGNTMGKITTNESLRGGGQSAPQQTVANVSFNINANDTRGFDELLQSRRGQIVTMINKAMANKGKRAIV